MQVPLAGVELAGCGKVGGLPVGLRPPCGCLLCLADGFQSEDAVQEPLLRGHQRFPLGPLGGGPGAEVFALHDDLARPHGQRPAGPHVRMREVEVPLPGDTPRGGDGGPEVFPWLALALALGEGEWAKQIDGALCLVAEAFALPHAH